MKYTTEVKCELAAVIGITLLFALNAGKEDLVTPWTQIVVGIFVLAGAILWYLKTKHLSHWDEIWIRPKYEIIAACAIFVISFIIVLETDIDITLLDYALTLVWGILFIPPEIRGYQNAVKYDMDNLSSLEELVEKYPEVRDKLSKKAKEKLEKSTENTSTD